MLNELLALERGLTAVGVAVGGRHQDIKDMAKSGVIRVRLREDGVLADVEVVPKGGRGALWTIRNGQQNGFPGLKLPRLDDKADSVHEAAWSAATSAAGKRAELNRLLLERRDATDIRAWPKPAHRQRIAERLGQLRLLELDPLAAVVPAVFDRFLKALRTPHSFTSALFDALKYE